MGDGMQKRSEATKQEKSFFRRLLKQTTILVLCILFALSTIYAVDISTYKLLENEKDTYAMRVTRCDEDTLRLDIAGKRYDVDIQALRAYSAKLSQGARNIVQEILEKVR
jgi:hypothetical protein